MLTVLEHLKQAGYDVSSAKTVIGLGTMECSSIQIRKFRCRPWPYEEAEGVEATAIVPFTDGYEHPYSMGWPRSSESKITAYFPVPEKEVAR